MTDDPPICDRLLEVGSDPSDRTISLLLGVGAGQALQLNIALPLVGALTAALATESRKLNEGLTEDERTDAVPINAKAAWLSQDDQGNPMLVFELHSGSLLPLSVQSGDFAGLAAEMSRQTAPKGLKH